MITGAQIRAARALVDWSAEDLAAASKIGVATIRRAESHHGVPNTTPANLEALARALRKAGAEFVGRGVTFRDLEVGDLVYNPFSETTEIGEVYETFAGQDQALMVRVRFPDHEMDWTFQFAFQIFPPLPSEVDVQRVLAERRK
jgi:transcriptional regulator with XRE-family HTH domain